LSQQLTEKFEQALQYATRLHATQVRKGKEIPYISHLLAVTSIVLENGGGEEEAIAALLHDAAEDQGGVATLAEIKKLFGDAVASIVADCTDAWTQPKPPWRVRKEQYIHHLSAVSPAVLLVSSADKLHNARSTLADYRQIGDAVWLRFKGGKAGTLWYEREITNAYKMLNTNGEIVSELDRVVSEIERLVTEAELTIV
jgi:(p)ppGpp synthase/HD superfamily hydrolase